MLYYFWKNPCSESWQRRNYYRPKLLDPFHRTFFKTQDSFPERKRNVLALRTWCHHSLPLAASLLDRNFRGARKMGALTGIVITMLSLKGTLCYVLDAKVGEGVGVSEKKIHRIWQKLAPSCLPSNNRNCYSLMSSWRRKWQPTPVLLPGESHGQRSLADYCPWGCKESDRTERLNHHHHCVLGMQSSQTRYNAHLIDRQRHSEAEWGILWQGNKPPVKPCW